MNSRQLILPATALAGAILLLSPARDANAWSKLGGNLALLERDVRVFDNFQDAAANANTAAHPQFPGQTGVELAIWKAVVEWGSEPHGDGSGDPTQANLGDGDANFDGVWSGISTKIGNTNENVISSINNCGGGTLAFAEVAFRDGWRIRFCDNWTWDDGPGSISGGIFDVQGIAVHEYGHALGLGHSAVGGATMFPSAGSGDTSLRSISPDDIAGLQAIYGAKSPSKPLISSVSADASTNVLTIEGERFSLTGNEVWFTPLAATGPSKYPVVVASGVVSTANGTRIDVPIPAEAGPGDVLVKRVGVGGAALSNAFPSDLTSGAPTTAASSPRNGSGANASCYTSLNAPVLGTTWMAEVDVSAHPGASISVILGYALPDAGTPVSQGELLVSLSSPKYFQDLERQR